MFDVGFRASVQGLHLTGERFRHRPGFYVKSVQGLLSGARVSSRTVAGGRRPGVLATPGRRDAPRRIVIAGFAWADSGERMQVMGDQFAGILADEEEFDAFAWHIFGRDRWASVARRGEWVLDPTGSTGFADLQLILEAPDQRVFGGPLETPGWAQTVTVVNRGSYAAPVEIDVRGNLPGGYTVTGPGGRRAVVTRSLATGVPHMYDADYGILWVSGAAQETGVAVSDAIEAPPGASTFTVTAGAEIRVRGDATYIP